jgi:hypothetical protein
VHAELRSFAPASKTACITKFAHEGKVIPTCSGAWAAGWNHSGKYGVIIGSRFGHVSDPSHLGGAACSRRVVLRITDIMFVCAAT